MNLREIKEGERPVCPQCGKPMVLVLSKSYYENVYGWQFDCDCVDEEQLKPDHDYYLSP